jgi:hypothetical protein
MFVFETKMAHAVEKRVDTGRSFAAILLIGLMFASGPARAETTTERPASILYFPKVIFDEEYETLIQISNTNNSMVHAHCLYVNAAGFCDARPSVACRSNSDCGVNGPCLPQWLEVDFDIWLTKQQPTHWQAGFGRLSHPLDPACNRNIPNYDCNEAGLDPGRVPPVGDPFYGELICIEVDPSGAPLSGNHLKGEATIVSRDGDASKYNAVGILGEPNTNDANKTLCLGGGVTEDCPSGAEYQACPKLLVLDHFAERADSPILGPESEVRTELTLIPCGANFELQRPEKVVVQFRITNEFELTFSASTTVECWASFLLNDMNLIFDLSRLGTRVVQTQMEVSNLSTSGIIGISEETHTLNGVKSRVAFNLHEIGNRDKTDLIIIPEGP